MICETIKSGLECSFMTKRGCTYNGGRCHTIVELCEGCGKILENTFGKFCTVYPNPASKWNFGKCPTATHLKREVAETTQKINPLKASKRSTKH